MPKRKLAFCITELNIGGAERAMTDLALRLNPAKFEVIVYSLQPRPHNETASCVPQLESAGIELHFLDIKGIMSMLSGFFRLRSLLQKQQPAIFLSFLFHANLLGRLAAKSVGVRHILSGIRVAEQERRQHLLLDRLTNKYVEKYLCVSESVMEFSRTVAKLPKEKITVIPNGIDFATIPDPDSAVKENRIIFVGRLTYQKGLDWMLKTVGSWLSQLSGWELWLVGDGEARPQLEKILRENENLDKESWQRIKFLGWRADASQLLAASKILILPSRWEGMPNVILQAMAAGLPVAATEVEGVAELLGDNAACQTCRFGDSEMFAKRILELATNTSLAAQLGRENRLRAEKFFDIRLIVRQYEDLFEGME